MSVVFPWVVTGWHWVMAPQVPPLNDAVSCTRMATNTQLGGCGRAVWPSAHPARWPSAIKLRVDHHVSLFLCCGFLQVELRGEKKTEWAGHVTKEKWETWCLLDSKRFIPTRPAAVLAGPAWPQRHWRLCPWQLCGVCLPGVRVRLSRGMKPLFPPRYDV